MKYFRQEFKIVQLKIYPLIIVSLQDDYMEAVSKLVLTAKNAHSINPAIHFEVFIHKVRSKNGNTVF